MDRVALISGASSGIGHATALALAGSYRLALVARDAGRLEALVAAIVARGGEALAISADLADAQQVPGVVERALARFARLDILVNNAGRFATAGPEQLDAVHLEGLWRINVQAPMLLVRHALPWLRAQRGHIVNVSSVAAEASFAGCGAYAATKAALEAWSRVLREELRGSGVRVGVVVPGATDTAVWGAADVDRTRMARAGDIAAAIACMLAQPSTASIDRLVITPPGGPF